MITQIIGFCEAGHTIPQTLVESLCKDCSSLAIIAAQDDDLLQQRIDKAVNAKEFMELQEGFKDITYGFVFHKGGKLSVESLQPFLIKNPSEKPIASILIGGTLLVSMPQNTSHTQSYHAWQKIERKLHRLYTNASDLAAFRKFILQDEEFNSDMDDILGAEGALTIMHYDGSMDHIGTARKGGQFSWGSISNTLGYSEKPAAEEKPKSGGMLAGLVKAGQNALSGGKKEEEPKAEPTVPPKADTIAASASKAETAVVPAGMIAFEMYTARKGLKKAKDLHRVLNDKLGCVPMGAWETYEAGGGWPVPKTGSIKFGRTDQYEIFREECAAAKVTYVPAEVLTRVPPKPPEEEKKPEATPDVNAAGIVSAKGKQHFHEKFLKRPGIMEVVTEKGNLALSPKALSKRDNRSGSTFAEQSGCRNGIYETLHWGPEDIRTFIAEEDKTLQFHLINDLMYEVIVLKSGAAKTAEAAPAPKKGMLAGLAKAS